MRKQNHFSLFLEAIFCKDQILRYECVMVTERSRLQQQQQQHISKLVRKSEAKI